MSTMNHQWLATMFLSQEEIDEIMGNLEVQNNENSNSSDIHISPFHFGENVTYEEISGKGYKGHVILVKDPSKVEIIDTRKKTTGTKLGEIVKSNNAVAGINAGGFKDEGGHGKGNVLAKSMIIDKTLYNGNKSTRYQFISNKETTIEVEAKQEANSVIIKVKDKGEKIPEYKLNQIFEKFYRLDAARTTEKGGAGLGLAIAKEIVDLHGGTIQVTSNNEITEFCVRLPIQ